MIKTIETKVPIDQTTKSLLATLSEDNSTHTNVIDNNFKNYNTLIEGTHFLLRETHPYADIDKLSVAEKNNFVPFLSSRSMGIDEIELNLHKSKQYYDERLKESPSHNDLITLFLSIHNNASTKSFKKEWEDNKVRSLELTAATTSMLFDLADYNDDDLSETIGFYLEVLFQELIYIGNNIKDIRSEFTGTIKVKEDNLFKCEINLYDWGMFDSLMKLYSSDDALVLTILTLAKIYIGMSAKSI